MRFIRELETGMSGGADSVVVLLPATLVLVETEEKIIEARWRSWLMACLRG